MKHRTPKVSSIEKSLDILTAFVPRNHEMGTAELSERLNDHPATVNRILRVLNQKGFARQSARTRKFVLGPSAFQLGKPIFQSISGNPLHVAMPHLTDLCEKVGETARLFHRE